MLLFAGLGNPGAKYANNRHNVGFMAADAIARRHSFSPWSKKFKAEIAEGTIGGDKVLLLKPQTNNRTPVKSTTTASHSKDDASVRETR